MVTKQPIGGILPNGDGGEASLLAVLGRASSRRKVKAIHRLCYDTLKSPMLTRLRKILLGQEVEDLEPADLCQEHGDRWTEIPGILEVIGQLDKYQNEAVVHALHPPGGIGIITGPPGTGITHPTVALTKVLVVLGHKVLLCAPGNESTYHLAGVVHAKYPELDVIRVYRPSTEEQQQKVGMTSKTGEDELVTRTMDVVSTLAQVKGDKRSRMTHKHLSLTTHCVKRALEIQSKKAQLGLDLDQQSPSLLEVDAFLNVLNMYETGQRPTKEMIEESGKQLKYITFWF